MPDLPSVPATYVVRCWGDDATKIGPRTWHIHARDDDEARSKLRDDAASRLDISGFSGSDFVQMQRLRDSICIASGSLSAMAR